MGRQHRRQGGRIAVTGNPGVRYGVIPLTIGPTLVESQRVNIIQHPLGQPKQLACVDNQVTYSDNTIVQYLTDTFPGSSGSPVFNDNWELTALHHSGGWIPEPHSASTHFRNEGIQVGAIIAHLHASGTS